MKIHLKKIDKYIEIVGSTNPRLNVMSKNYRARTLTTLQEHYTQVSTTIVNDLAALKALVARKPDFVVLGMKMILLDPSKSYEDSPKIWLPDYLKKNGISFTGSDTGALLLEYDKHLAKQKVIDAGLESSAYYIAKINQPFLNQNLRFPLFVKPIDRGCSKGIDEQSVVESESELRTKVLSIHAIDSDALVEEYLPGREFSVAVIRRLGSKELVAMPIEITAPRDSNGNSFLSQAVKSDDTEKVSAVTDIELKDKIGDFAVNVFRTLGARDYGRIDMRLDSLGNPSFIEANLMPGLSDHGYLSRCFYLNSGIAYDDMILSIISLGLERVTKIVPKKVVRVLHDLSEVGVPELAGTGAVI